MKLRSLALVLSVTLSFVATSSENQTTAKVKPVEKLTKQQLKEQKEKEWIKQLIIPCEPYPKCT